ncbi:MAG: flippase [Patescibacteria group bacterium]|nr:MAG: flippase [Patescibacteria group bacterium]
MTVKIANIAKNTSYFTLALVIQKIISLTYFTIYARELGPADLGQYYFAISITSIFSIFLDIGIGNVITREVAKYQEKARSYVANVLGLKFILGFMTLSVLFVWTQAWEYNELTKHLIYISAASMILDGFTATFYAALRGFHNLFHESIASVVFQLIVLFSSLMIFARGLSIEWLMASLVLASLFNLIYSAIIGYRVKGLSLKPTLNKVILKPLLIIAAPFAVFLLFQRSYTYFDSVLLFKLAGDYALGIYQIPFKIILALQFLPMAFVASLYPALSSYWHNNKEQLSVTFTRAINYSLILSIPVAVGVIIMAEPIVALFQSGFAEAANPLRLSMLAIPFIFLGYPVGSLLNACDKQKRNTINMGITALASIILNLILIPKFGVLGACLTVVLTSFLMLILGWSVVPKIIEGSFYKTFKLFPKIILAGLIMGFGVYWLKDYWHPVLVIAVGAMLYGIALFLVRAITLNDLKSIYSSFVK